MFRQYGWFFIPASIVGVGIAGAALIFIIQTFLVIDSQSHSASDTLYGWYPYAVTTFLAYQWIAGNLKDRKS